jgi:MFS family permease
MKEHRDEAGGAINMRRRMPGRPYQFTLSPFLLFALRALICFSFFYIPIFLKESGFSGWEIGFLMGVDSLTALACTLPMGLSNDLITPRKLIFISFLVLALAFYLISISATFGMYVFVFVVMGIGCGLAQISIKAVIFKTTGRKNRAGRLSVLSFAEHGGIALGPLAGGILLLTFDFSNLFVITAVLFLAISPLVLLLPKTRTRLFTPAEYKKDLMRREVIFFSIVTFLYAYHWGAEKTVYTIFLKDSLGFDSLQIGIFIGVTVGLLALSSLFYGKLLDLKVASMKKLFFAGLLLSAGGHLLLALSRNGAQAYCFRIIHELGDSSFMIFSYVMTAALFKRSRVGGGSGVITQVAVVAATLGALTSGALLEHFGPRAPMIVASLVAVPCIYFVRGLGLEGEHAFGDEKRGSRPVGTG